jgi:hypothetical protein
MRDRMGNKGFVKVVFIILIIAAIAFVLISFGTPYYKYYRLGSSTRDFLKSEIGNIDVIRLEIMKEAQELGIALDEKNLDITLDKKIIRINATWSETVDFWGYYQQKFDFTMKEEY